MLLLIGVPVLFLVIVLAAIAYQFSNSLLLRESTELMQETAARYGAQMHTLLTEKKGYIDIIATDIEKEIPSKESLLKTLTFFTESRADVSDFFMGYEDKSFLDGAGWDAPADYDPTSRGWYTDAVSSGSIILSKPYRTGSDGTMVFTVAKEIKEKGKRIGVLGIDIAFDSIYEIVNQIQILKTGRAFLVDPTGDFIVHSQYTPEDNLFQVEHSKFYKLEGTLLTGKSEFLEASFDGNAWLYSATPVEGTNWILVISVPKSEVLAPSAKLGQFMLIIGLAAVLIVLALIYVVANSIAKPIRLLSQEIERIGNYDLREGRQTPVADYAKRKGEVGIIAKSLLQVQQTMKEIMSEISDIACQLTASSEELTATSQQSAGTSAEMERSVHSIFESALQQAEEMERGTAAMDVMKAALLENKMAVRDLNTTVRSVMNARENGVVAVQELVRTAEKVQESSQTVMQVIINSNESAMRIESASDMIQSLAKQTNLLALNAAIEAARAGDKGRGFAVVADKIRELAEQSTKFTEEISSIVFDLNSKTSKAVEIMGEVNETIDSQTLCVRDTDTQFSTISEEIEHINQSLEQLNLSGGELERTKENLLGIIETVNHLSHQNKESDRQSVMSAKHKAASSEDIAGSSSHLTVMAQEMSAITGKFAL
ncbi:MAG: methyl-accepting chemotaxis protein [Bacillota bacterium]|nr:methyl-accepting chemotaxis protein [Bacillota bacterium]